MWTSNELNLERKQVLIKFVITFIPTFSMSMFALPKTWCSEIKGLITNFWWGVSNERKKIYWRRWGTLTRSKAVGGLGIQEWQTLIVALLTKMANCIVSEPDTLCVRVIKGKYCMNEDFLTATKGCHTSWWWSSLLMGRDVIKRDKLWQIGDRASIKVFRDPWIHTTHDHRAQPNSSHEDQNNKVVGDLIEVQTRT